MNQNILELKNQDVTKIFKDEFGTPVVVLDKNGLRTTDAGSGIDVTTATNDQLSSNSAQRTFRIVTKNSSLSIPSFSIASGGSSLLTVAHGQVSTPVVQVYATATLLNFGTGTAITSSRVPTPLLQSSAYSVTGYLFPAANGSFYPITITYICDATNVYIQATYASSAATTINAIPVTYFVLQEKII